jgi:hypothetical protein
MLGSAPASPWPLLWRAIQEPTQPRLLGALGPRAVTWRHPDHPGAPPGCPGSDPNGGGPHQRSDQAPHRCQVAGAAASFRLAQVEGPGPEGIDEAGLLCGWTSHLCCWTNSGRRMGGNTARWLSSSDSWDRPRDRASYPPWPSIPSPTLT